MKDGIGEPSRASLHLEKSRGRAGPGERRYLQEWVQTGGELGAWFTGVPPDAELVDVGTATHGVGVGEQGEE